MEQLQKEINDAIEIIKECQQIHKDYADWQEVTPDWKELIESESVGDTEHHRKWVENYEKVIGILTNYKKLTESVA